MDIKKIAVAISGFFGLIILFFIISSLSGRDSTAPKLAIIIDRNNTMQSASDLASGEAGDFELRSKAATASVSLSSDTFPLIEYLSANSDIRPPKANENFATELKRVTEADEFNAKYTQHMRDNLQKNISDLKLLIDSARNTRLEDTLQDILDNQQILLEQYN
jgi:uncharacterized membrane-anchored protein